MTVCYQLYSVNKRKIAMDNKYQFSSLYRFQEMVEKVIEESHARDRLFDAALHNIHVHMCFQRKSWERKHLNCRKRKSLRRLFFHKCSWNAFLPSVPSYSPTPRPIVRHRHKNEIKHTGHSGTHARTAGMHSKD